MTRELVFTKAPTSFTPTKVSVKLGNRTRGNGIEYLFDDDIDDNCDRPQLLGDVNRTLFSIPGDSIFQAYKVVSAANTIANCFIFLRTFKNRLIQNFSLTQNSVSVVSFILGHDRRSTGSHHRGSIQSPERVDRHSFR